eukprot:COSAG05_NODE_371_length_10705_cov_99.051475_6_plen_68_part_00
MRTCWIERTICAQVKLAAAQRREAKAVKKRLAQEQLATQRRLAAEKEASEKRLAADAAAGTKPHART